MNKPASEIRPGDRIVSHGAVLKIRRVSSGISHDTVLLMHSGGWYSVREDAQLEVRR